MHIFMPELSCCLIANGEDQIFLTACFRHLRLLGNETHLGGTHLTSLTRILHSSFGYGHLLCQTPMRRHELGWANCALGTQSPLSNLHAIWIPTRHSVWGTRLPLLSFACLITPAQRTSGEQKSWVSLQQLIRMSPNIDTYGYLER